MPDKGTCISVSLRGDAEYVDALRKLARRKKVRIGDITRAACDRMLGDELAPFLAPAGEYVRQHSAEEPINGSSGDGR